MPGRAAGWLDHGSFSWPLTLSRSTSLAEFVTIIQGPKSQEAPASGECYFSTFLLWDGQEEGRRECGRLKERPLLLLNCDLTLALEAGLFGPSPQSLTWAVQSS